MGIRERKSREERERLSRAAQMPHRQNAGDSQLDARLESPLGRLFFSGEITRPQYEAGIRFDEIMTRWCESIDAPAPYGGEMSSIDDDLCLRRKIILSQAKSILDDVAPRCFRIVSRIAFYESEPRDAMELTLLRMGLGALSGDPIAPFVGRKRNLAAA